MQRTGPFLLNLSKPLEVQQKEAKFISFQKNLKTTWQSHYFLNQKSRTLGFGQGVFGVGSPLDFRISQMLCGRWPPSRSRLIFSNRFAAASMSSGFKAFQLLGACWTGYVCCQPNGISIFSESEVAGACRACLYECIMIKIMMHLCLACPFTA